MRFAHPLGWANAESEILCCCCGGRCSDPLTQLPSDTLAAQLLLLLLDAHSSCLPEEWETNILSVL